MSTFYSHSWPKARIQHYCVDCSRIIQPGEVYRRGFGADGGDVWTWKECAHCTTLLHIIDWDESYGWGTFDDWGVTTAAHLRLKALWRKRWTRRDGTLYPIPTIVTTEDRYGFGRVVDVVLNDEPGDPVWPQRVTA